MKQSLIKYYKGEFLVFRDMGSAPEISHSEKWNNDISVYDKAKEQWQTRFNGKEDCVLDEGKLKLGGGIMLAEKYKQDLKDNDYILIEDKDLEYRDSKAFLI